VFSSSSREWWWDLKARLSGSKARLRCCGWLPKGFLCGLPLGFVLRNTAHL
jgi:hypothetical protein